MERLHTSLWQRIYDFVREHVHIFQQPSGYREKRKYRRIKRRVAIACRVHIDTLNENVCSGEEILTKANDISRGGLCINWPRMWGCLLCKHRIDLKHGTPICECDECSFSPKFDTLPIGLPLSVSIQLQDTIVERIQGRVVWYTEADDSGVAHDTLGFCFTEPIDYDI